MAKEVKIKCIEIGVGLLLYIIALFSVRHWSVSGNTEFILFLLPYLVMAAGIFLDMVKNI